MKKNNRSLQNLARALSCTSLQVTVEEAQQAVDWICWGMPLEVVKLSYGVGYDFRLSDSQIAGIYFRGTKRIQIIKQRCLLRMKAYIRQQRSKQ